MNSTARPATGVDPKAVSGSASGPAGAPVLGPETVAEVRRALLAHYDRTRRDLPWRGETDPYRIWVSEIMLQQTRVETVIPYYRLWLERFPDVAALADAEVDEVLLAWQGLGYYRRARALHAGAALVREKHGGAMPHTVEGLRALPGVGEYTAGAVASIAYGEAVPAVDGNVKRVFSRLFDEAKPGVAWLRGTAGALVDPDRPGDWNQALMDLGATLCTPRSPSCDACPLGEMCRARAAGTQEERPAPAPRKTVPSTTFATAVVVTGDGRALVVRRDEGGLLGGLWAFPDMPLDGEGVSDAADGAASGVALADGHVFDSAAEAARRAGTEGIRVVEAPEVGLLPPIRHRFSHLAATYRPVLLAGEAPEDQNRRWISLKEPWPVALPVAQQKIARAAAAALAEL